MPIDPRLPEIERGTEVFAVDPLTIGVHFEVDYIHIGMPLKAKFRRKATWTVRDVYFVRAKT